MPSHWEETTWGEAVELKYGKAIRGYQEANEAYPVFGTNGQVGTHSHFVAEGPGVILGRKGAYRGVHYSKQPFFVIDTAYFVEPKQELDMRWLYYAMQFYKLGQIDDGSPIPSTTRAAVYSSEFKRPPIGEQRDIATCLGSLDDKIEMNRRMNETLEEMARALFRDWFVDFGPTRRQMTMKEKGLAADPAAIMGHAFPPEKAATLAPLFPAKLGDDGQPEGWETGAVGDVLTLQRGFDLPKKSRLSGPYPVIAASGVHGSHIEAKVTGPGVVTGRSGVIGVVQFVPSDFWPLNTALWVKEFKLGSPLHSYFLLKTLDLKSINSGSAVPSLNRNYVHAVEVVLPARSVVSSFETFASTLFAKIKANQQENQTLAEMRDLLLPKLMSGEIRLKDVEDIL